MIEDNTSSTHPPLPPTTEDERIARLRLWRSRRVGPATYRRLLGEHGSARAALDALPDIARTSGVSDYKICPMGVLHAELNAAHSSKARLVFEVDPDFPNDLAQIDDAPVMLWMTGTPSVLHRPLIALVGARNASSLGTRMARKLAQDLGEAGFTVVSDWPAALMLRRTAALSRRGPSPWSRGASMFCIRRKTQILPKRFAQTDFAYPTSPWGCSHKPAISSPATASYLACPKRRLSLKPHPSQAA